MLGSFQLWNTEVTAHVVLRNPTVNNGALKTTDTESQNVP